MEDRARLGQVFEVKGMVQKLLHRLGMEGSLREQEISHLKPGTGLEVVVGESIGYLGESAVEKSTVGIAELDFELLSDKAVVTPCRIGSSP